MSIKIKINWDNENVVSESVRIYRADSIFTPTSLPPLLTEIVGNVYEYEDLTTVEDQTYFYMLSAKLGEQEVFTECFDVVAEQDIDLLQLIIPAFNASTITESTFLATGQFVAASSIIFNNLTGEYLVGGTITSGQRGVKRFNSSGGLIEILSFPDVIGSISISKNGKKFFIRSGLKTYQYDLINVFQLTGATLVNTFDDFAGLSENNTSTIFVNEKTTLSKIYSATNLIITRLTNPYDLSSIQSQQEINVLSKLTLRGTEAKITSMLMSDDGLKLVVCTGTWATGDQRFHVLTLSTAFDLNTATESSYKNLSFTFTRGTPIGFRPIDRFFVVGDVSGRLVKLKY